MPLTWEYWYVKINLPVCAHCVYRVRTINISVQRFDTTINISVGITSTHADVNGQTTSCPVASRHRPSCSLKLVHSWQRIVDGLWIIGIVAQNQTQKYKP